MSVSKPDILEGDEFDRLIAGKFPPQRRRSEPMDFKPTVTRACTGPCDQGRDKCATPEACRLPTRDENDDSEFGALEGLVRGRRYHASAWVALGAIALGIWGAIEFVRSYL
jgi:hypothetical protein